MATLFLRTVCTAAQSPFDWIAGTGREDNGLILLAVESADLETALGSLRAVGRRGDPRVEDLLLAFADRYSRRSAHESELMLRVLLESVFPPSLDEEELRSRAALNRSGLERLMRGLSAMSDPVLRGRILELSALAPGPPAAARLMSEGRRLALLQRSRAAGPALDVEVLALLEAALRLETPDLADTCLVLAETSRNRSVVVRARQVAAALLELRPAPGR